jgi:3-isopropylmalate dehydrogenase
MNIANPIAMIASLAMALRYSLNQTGLADILENSIKIFIEKGYRTKDISTTEDYIKTSEVAASLIEIMKNE